MVGAVGGTSIGDGGNGSAAAAELSVVSEDGVVAEIAGATTGRSAAGSFRGVGAAAQPVITMNANA